MQYLKGAYLLKKRRPDDVRRAFEYLSGGDPAGARLRGTLLRCGNVLHRERSVMERCLPEAALPEAEDLVSKGLALDENSASLHSTLGMLRMFQWRWAESEQAHRRAISLEPTNAFPHMAYPILCSFLGRHDEAVFHAGKAVELDPLDLMTNFRLVQANYYARRYDEAVRTGRIAIELTPDSPYTYFYLALSLARVGLKGRSLEHGESWAESSTMGCPLARATLGILPECWDTQHEARTVIKELEARREKGYGPALPIAWTYLGLGETLMRLSTGWRRLWLNATRSWDLNGIPRLTTQYAIKQDSSD